METKRDIPAAVNDEVDDDVFAEVVAVLERDVHCTLDVCINLWFQHSPTKGCV